MSPTPLKKTDDAGAVGAPRATRRDWGGLAVIALPCLLYSMDLTVLNLAVPHLSADLGPSAAPLLWIVDIYGFLVAGSLITMGTLATASGGAGGSSSAACSSTPASAVWPSACGSRATRWAARSGPCSAGSCSGA